VPWRERRHRQSDRHVEPEDPMPADPIHDRAAEHRAYGHGHTADCAPEADRLAALCDREGLADQSQREREDHGRPRALNDTRGDQRADARRQRGGGRRGREYRDPERENPPTAEAVTERRPGHQQAGKREDEGVDRPLQGRKAGVQVGAQHRKRCRHDQVVERGHEQPERGENERPGLVRWFLRGLHVVSLRRDPHRKRVGRLLSAAFDVIRSDGGEGS
jgi:hypothetical protein